MVRVFLVILIMAPMFANSQSPAVPGNNDTPTHSQNSTGSTVAPPVARKIRTQKTVNGKTLVDDYAWLRDRSNPDVKAFLEAENAYTEYVMQPTGPLQKKLYDEIVSHIKENDETVPYLDDGYYYYTRTEKGKQYFQLRRRKGSLDASEQVILDLNQMGEGQKFMAVGRWAVKGQSFKSARPSVPH